ncbi:hypothetical protein HY439_01825 [Candidatus Microgenomates bacterium]|nr:hypothetical protein [Candidatus Microgenomates bacterium]
MGFSEALRVLKPGGKLKIFPWISKHYEWSKMKRKNAAGLLGWLESKGISYDLQSSHPADPPHLTIIKPRIS